MDLIQSAVPLGAATFMGRCSIGPFSRVLFMHTPDGLQTFTYRKHRQEPAGVAVHTITSSGDVVNTDQLRPESLLDHVFDSYRGLCMQFARDQAQCERRPFSWTDTHDVCTFRCRCTLHEKNSVTA